MLTYPLYSTMYYILYDLRAVGTNGLAQLCLPTEADDGPILLQIEERDYVELSSHLQEMLQNEGDYWSSSQLMVSGEDAANTSDLTPMQLYIIVVHKSLLMRSISAGDLYQRLASMRRLLLN